MRRAEGINSIEPYLILTPIILKIENYYAIVLRNAQCLYSVYFILLIEHINFVNIYMHDTEFLRTELFLDDNFYVFSISLNINLRLRIFTIDPKKFIVRAFSLIPSPAKVKKN